MVSNSSESTPSLSKSSQCSSLPPSILLRSAPTSPVRNSSNNNSSALGFLECDYDVNPTYLYQAIEARQWKHAQDFLSGDNEEQDKQAHVQAATWVIRKETNGKLRWRLLPLHAAIIFGSPLALVELLLGEHPAAAQSKDDQGMLPLHLAFRNFSASSGSSSSWDVLEELLTAYPQAISVKDRRGRTPLQCASSSFRKPASVLELYTHVAITTERVVLNKKNKNELQAQIGALQESHVAVLEGLKADWQRRSLLLEQQLAEFQAHHDALNVLYRESQEELAKKMELERELTTKLTLVTDALTASEVSSTAAAASELEAETVTLQALHASEAANAELACQNQTLHSENVQLRTILLDMLKNQNDLQQRLDQYCAVKQDDDDRVVQERKGRVEALLQTLMEEMTKSSTDEDGFVKEMQREWQQSNQRAAELLSQLLLLDGSGDASGGGGGGGGGNYIDDEVQVLVDVEQGGNFGASGEEVQEEEPNDMALTLKQEEEPNNMALTPQQEEEPNDMTLTPQQEEEEEPMAMSTPPVPPPPASQESMDLNVPLPDPPTFPSESTTTTTMSSSTRDSDDVPASNGNPSVLYAEPVQSQ